MKDTRQALVVRIVCQIAEFEHSLIRERMTAGIADAKRRGKHVGRRCSRSVVFRAVGAAAA